MDSQSSVLSAGSQGAATAATTPAAPTDVAIDQTNNGEASAEQTLKTSQSDEDNALAPKTLKTATEVKTLTADERKKLRAQKFGSNANSVPAGSPDQKLQKRAQRFGAVVSEQLKKVEDTQKLEKRKERFGAITAPSSDTSSKRKISSSSNNKDQLQKRLARFGKA